MSISSAKRNRTLQIGLPPMEIVRVWPWSVACMILFRDRLKSVGESMHPCLTPMVVWKNSPVGCFRITVPVVCSLRGLHDLY